MNANTYIFFMAEIKEDLNESFYKVDWWKSMQDRGKGQNYPAKSFYKLHSCSTFCVFYQEWCWKPTRHISNKN